MHIADKLAEVSMKSRSDFCENFRDLAGFRGQRTSVKSKCFVMYKCKLNFLGKK